MEHYKRVEGIQGLVNSYMESYGFKAVQYLISQLNDKYPGPFLPIMKLGE